MPKGSHWLMCSVCGQWGAGWLTLRII